jgi:hypothetical protein
MAGAIVAGTVIFRIISLKIFVFLGSDEFWDYLLFS